MFDNYTGLEVKKPVRSDPAEAKERPILDVAGYAEAPKEPILNISMKSALLAAGTVIAIGSVPIGACGLYLPLGAGTPYIEGFVYGETFGAFLVLASAFFGRRDSSRDLGSGM